MVIDEDRVLYKLPMKDKKSDYFYIYEEDINYLSDTYQSVFIESELRMMRAWLENNPQRKKTYKGTINFIHRWLMKVERNPSKNGTLMKDCSKHNYPYEEIMSYLNTKLKKNFRLSDEVIGLINDRFKDGYKKEDFFKVVNNMYDEWSFNNKMAKHLKPTTLFGKRFDEYLNVFKTKSLWSLDDDETK